MTSQLTNRISISPGDHHIDQAAKASGSQRPIEQPVADQTASSPIAEEVAILKEELEKLKAQVADQLSKQPSDKGSAIDGLDKNVRGSKRKLDESEEELEKPIRIGSDVSRNEITFTWKLKGVNALLTGRWRMPEVSSIFNCGCELEFD